MSDECECHFSTPCSRRPTREKTSQRRDRDATSRRPREVASSPYQHSNLRCQSSGPAAAAVRCSGASTKHLLDRPGNWTSKLKVPSHGSSTYGDISTIFKPRHCFSDHSIDARLGILVEPCCAACRCAPTAGTIVSSMRSNESLSITSIVL